MNDDNVLDARARFAAQERANPTARRADEARLLGQSLRQTQLRLAEADRVAEELRKAVRVPEADRPRLARNLGRMIEASTDDPHPAIGMVFKTVFGPESAASALKKRKRYVRLATESLVPVDTPGEYHARGADFVRLAEACASELPSSQESGEDARRRAILNLIEGTSFDTRADGTLRRSEAGRRELADRLAEVLVGIEKVVDLDRYFDLACELPLTASVNYGPIDRVFDVQDNTKWSQLRVDEDEADGPSGEDEDERGSTHWLAPKVLLGFLYSPIKVDQGIRYTVPATSEGEDHDNDLVSSLAIRYGTERLPFFEKAVAEFQAEVAASEMGFVDFDLKEWDAQFEAERRAQERFLSRIQAELGLDAPPPPLHEPHAERIRKALVLAHGEKAARLVDDASRSDEWWEIWSECADDMEERLWNAQTVFLSIFQERATGRPRLALTVSQDEWRVEHDRVITRFPTYAGDRDFVPRLLDSHGSDLSYVEEGLDTGYLIYGLDSLSYRQRSPFAGRLIFAPGDKALNLLFSPVSRKPQDAADSIFRPLFEDHPSGYSPAPWNSIAGAILRNLAHAGPGKRLDELLLADAKSKAGEMSDLLEQQEREYRRGVRRLKVQGTHREEP